MFVFSMVVFLYIFFQMNLFFPLSQRSHQISQLLWTAGSTSKSWSICPWYKNQPTNMVHQDHFAFSLLGTRCSSENITEDVGWRYDAQGCLGSIFEKSERWMARIHPIRESWYSAPTCLSSSPGYVQGHCVAECKRSLSSNTTRFKPIYRRTFELFFHLYQCRQYCFRAASSSTEPDKRQRNSCRCG